MARLHGACTEHLTPHAQVLPLVKAFFVLCDARTSHLPPPAAARRAPSVEAPGGSGIARGASMEVSLPPVASAAAAAQAAEGGATLEGHLPFLRCGPSCMHVPVGSLPCVGALLSVFLLEPPAGVA